MKIILVLDNKNSTDINLNFCSINNEAGYFIE